MASGSTKFKNSIHLEPQSSDPSSPAEGDLQFSDGTARAKGIWQYKDGAWAETGGSGSGGINYLEGDNSNAENGVGDWGAYKDAAGTEPVDGTGGTATVVSVAQNSTTPLRGTNDLKITKTGSNAQGEGISCAFTIDEADKAKKLTISFDYNVTANYADDDVKVFVYDVTNSNLIRVNGEDLKANSNNATHYAQFQTASDSTSYRLILHASSTSTLAYDIQLDNISVGPTKLAKGTIVTDRITFTPTGTWSGPTYNGVWWREGQHAIIEYEVTYAGSPTGTFSIDMPSGLVIDTAAFANYTGGNEAGILSGGFIHDITGSRQPIVNVLPTSSTLLTPQIQTSGSPYTGVSFNTTSPFTFATGDRIYFSVKVPIQGWSSNAQMSEDLGGREVVFLGRLSGTQTISSTSETTVEIAAMGTDTTGSFDTANYKFVVPESGNYVFSMKAYDSGYTDNYLTYKVKEGSNILFSVDAPTANSPRNTAQTTPPLALTKGQEITFTVQSVADASYTLVPGVANTFFSGYKLASPQTMLETETVAARYTSNNGQTLSNNAQTTVVYEDTDYDTHGAYNTSTGEYTVPVNGMYDIHSKVYLSGFGSTAGEFLVIYIFVNGSEKSRDVIEFTGATTVDLTARITDKLNLAKGDVVTVKVFQDSGAGVNLATTTSGNVFSIARIK